VRIIQTVACAGAGGIETQRSLTACTSGGRSERQKQKDIDMPLYSGLVPAILYSRLEWTGFVEKTASTNNHLSSYGSCK